MSRSDSPEELERERQAKRDASYAWLGEHLDDYTWGDKIRSDDPDVKVAE